MIDININININQSLQLVKTGAQASVCLAAKI